MQIVTVDFEQPLIITKDGIKVTVVTFRSIEPSLVKFGVEAPKTIKVNREEIHEAIKGKKNFKNSQTPDTV